MLARRGRRARRPSSPRDHLRLARRRSTRRSSAARPPTTTRALRRAAQLLGRVEPRGATRLSVLGCWRRPGFAGEPPWAAGRGPELARRRPRATAKLPQPRGHRAATRAGPRPRAARRARLAPRSRNFGAQTVEERRLHPARRRRAVARGLVDARPRRDAQKRFSATLPPATRATAEVVGRARRRRARRSTIAATLRVEVRRDVRVLLVDGDPRTVRHDDELFYLETALRPGDRDDSAARRRPPRPSTSWPRRRLADFDVVFLCNVQAARAEARRRARGVGAEGRRPPRRARRQRRSRRLRRDDGRRSCAQELRTVAPVRRSGPRRADAGARRAPRPLRGRCTRSSRSSRRKRARAARGELLEDRCSSARRSARRPSARCWRASATARRARRGAARAGAAAPLHLDARSRLERSADPPRLPAARAADGALPRALAGRGARDRARRRAHARHPGHARRRARRGHRAERQEGTSSRGRGCAGRSRCRLHRRRRARLLSRDRRRAAATRGRCRPPTSSPTSIRAAPTRAAWRLPTSPSGAGEAAAATSRRAAAASSSGTVWPRRCSCFSSAKQSSPSGRNMLPWPCSGPGRT